MSFFYSNLFSGMVKFTRPPIAVNIESRVFGGSFGSELKLRGLQNRAATSIRGKHTASPSSNPCSPPIRVSCSTTDTWLPGIRHWNQTLKYRLKKFFKVGLRSRQEGSEPGSVGIFGTSDCFPKTTSAPAKSASYMLQTTSPPPDTPSNKNSHDK